MGATGSEQLWRLLSADPDDWRQRDQRRDFLARFAKLGVGNNVSVGGIRRLESCDDFSPGHESAMRGHEHHRRHSAILPTRTETLRIAFRRAQMLSSLRDFSEKSREHAYHSGSEMSGFPLPETQ